MDVGVHPYDKPAPDLMTNQDFVEGAASFKKNFSGVMCSRKVCCSKGESTCGCPEDGGGVRGDMGRGKTRKMGGVDGNSAASPGRRAVDNQVAS